MQQEIKDAILKPREFKTRADVLKWFRELLDAGVNFHPEDSGAGLIDIGSSVPTFSEDESKRYDALMKEATVACEFAYVDVCAVACEAFDQFMADNSLAVAATGDVAKNIKAQGAQLERAVREHHPQVVLQALAESLRSVSDESRSNGPNALSSEQKEDLKLAHAIEDFIETHF